MAPPADAPAAELTDMPPAKVEGESESVGGKEGTDASWRVVVIGDPEQSNAEAKYPVNKVRTSKYTLLTFLPRNLWEQFHRVAYIYFAIIMVSRTECRQL
jgi:phospholipid-transporting ATPase